MNSLLATLGIESWKPFFSVLLLPPVPFLVLVLVGARLILPRRGLGWFVLLIGVTGLWLSTCAATGHLLTQWALKPPAPLSLAGIAELKDAAKARRPVAIVVLGGGVEALAPEYGVSNLLPAALERLRYGMWLQRETGLPVAFSGGVGWGVHDVQAEAQVAARVAAQDFGRPLKWTEDTSRDTRENAIRTVTMLRADGITHIVLVTHGTHMPRALRAFETAAGGSIRIQPAPMGLKGRQRWHALDWFPSASGYAEVSRAVHELIGLAAGV